jgi:hypothetical protein
MRFQRSQDEKTKRTIEEMTRHEDEILGGYEFTVSSPETLSRQASESGSEVKNKRVISLLRSQQEVNARIDDTMRELLAFIRGSRS